MLRTMRMVGLVAMAAGLLVSSPGRAQESDDAPPSKKGSKQWTQEQIDALREGQDTTRQQIEALEQGQKDIQKQLADIKRLLQQQQQQQRQPARRAGPQVEDVSFHVGANDIKGHADAKLTLIEFTDYQ